MHRLWHVLQSWSENFRVRKIPKIPNEPENFDSGFRSERYFSFAVRSDLEHSFVRKFPNPERSDYTNLMRNYEACKGAKIGSIRPEPINWSPGGYRMADKINQTVSQSIHWFISPASLCNCIRHTACTMIIVYAGFCLFLFMPCCVLSTTSTLQNRCIDINFNLRHGIEPVGRRTTVMMDENFEQKLFCNVNKEVMLCGRKRKLAEIIK